MHSIFQNSHLSIEEFHAKLQEATNFPLRPFVIPFLKVKTSYTCLDIFQWFYLPTNCTHDPIVNYSHSLREIIHNFWLATFHAEYDLGEVGFLFCLISPRKHTCIVHTNWKYH